jgi:DnaJ-class molecular chaperone
MKLKKMMIQLSEPCSECDGSGYVITDQVTGCCIPDVGFVEKCTECGGKATKAAHNMTVEEFIKLLKQQRLL